MTTLSVEKWDRRNCQLLPSGEIVVREALATPTTLGIAGDIEPGTNLQYMGGVSIKNPRTGAVWHYILAYDTDLSKMSIIIFDDNWMSIQQVLLASTPVGLDRYAFCVSQVGDELSISSPYFSTQWGPVGSGITTAVKVESVNFLNTTAVDVPSGISVSWAGRNVIADGQAIWFSDALAPRTFVSQNALAFPGGAVFGLHVNAGGALIICSQDGVYALPETAAAAGQIVVGIFQKLSDHPTTKYETTCVSRGRVFGLTERGYALVDVEGAEDVYLDEDILSRTLVPRIAFQDYRLGRIYGTEAGPICSLDGFMHVVDYGVGFKSWWNTYDSSAGSTQGLKLRGILREASGEEVFLTELLPRWRFGERDDLVSATEVTYGVSAGLIPMAAEQSLVLRYARFISDSRFNLEMSLNGISKVASVPTPIAPIIGTSTWGADVYTEPEIYGRRFIWANRSRNFGLELRVKRFPSRMPESASIEFAGPGKSRP